MLTPLGYPEVPSLVLWLLTNTSDCPGSIRAPTLECADDSTEWSRCTTEMQSPAGHTECWSAGRIFLTIHEKCTSILFRNAWMQSPRSHGSTLKANRWAAYSFRLVAYDSSVPLALTASGQQVRISRAKHEKAHFSNHFVGEFSMAKGTYIQPMFEYGSQIYYVAPIKDRETLGRL